MKKIYICLLGFFTASAFTAQVQNSNFSPLERKNSHLVGQIKPSKLTQNTKETILWSNSFNTPSDWVINNTAGTPGLGWEFSSNPAAIPTGFEKVNPNNSLLSSGLFT